jgi:uncharacterized damage-inducible protein DinB
MIDSVFYSKIVETKSETDIHLYNWEGALLQKKQQLLEEFSVLISFVESLRELDEQLWVTPIQEGKWTTRDIIAHIMRWDQYFLEEGIQKIASQQPVTIQHLDFQEFNQKSVEFAKGKSKQEIIDLTIFYRSEILRQIASLSDVEFTKEHLDGDGNKFSAYSYLMDFIPHDFHHIDQIKAFTSKSS